MLTPNQTITNRNGETNPAVDQNHPRNPYPPPATKQNPSKEPAPNKHTLTHSPQTFPPSSPPYSDFKCSPYSPTDPSATYKPASSVTPPQNPNQSNVAPNTPVTPARSFNPNFLYPPSTSNSTAGHTPFNPEAKRVLDFGSGKKIVRSVKK